jgi:hypothetical protein
VSPRGERRCASIVGRRRLSFCRSRAIGLPWDKRQRNLVGWIYRIEPIPTRRRGAASCRPRRSWRRPALGLLPSRALSSDRRGIVRARSTQDKRRRPLYTSKSAPRFSRHTCRTSVTSPGEATRRGGIIVAEQDRLAAT